MSRHHLEQLTDLAERHHCATLHYRSRLTPSVTRPRIVEPYNLTQGKEDIMVRCYQLYPVEGWRYFMVHKIDDVRDAGVEFTPRRDVTLPTDELITFGGARDDAPWTEAMLEYRDAVSDALADGIVRKEEFDAVKEIGRGLTDEQIRYVHASLFHRCLGAILRDGTVGESQLAEIRLVQRVLSGLGWGVTGSAR